ncbi:superoxide dismutase [bacterium BMS3Abin03]|jgi:hypothetical protein|nr:superoxide dismutase [bacterium BMS3Abin03]MCG6959063.1 superoxide dismutase [bacterium BMS3Abin03]
MKILAIEKETSGKTGKDFEPHLKNEAKEVWNLYREDFIREIYFNKEKHTAILILECENEKEADLKLNSLPLVKEKLIQFELIPLIPYDGFSRLFK